MELDKLPVCYTHTKGVILIILTFPSSTVVRLCNLHTHTGMHAPRTQIYNIEITISNNIYRNISFISLWMWSQYHSKNISDSPCLTRVAAANTCNEDM